MTAVTVDRQRISDKLKATVTVTSDFLFDAIEARATKANENFGRGQGGCLLSDDTSPADGVLILSAPVNEFSFDVEKTELFSDGEYRISVFLRNTDGVWNDCSALLTPQGENLVDSLGRKMFAKRNVGTEETYISAYDGTVIDNFITEVLS